MTNEELARKYAGCEYCKGKDKCAYDPEERCCDYNLAEEIAERKDKQFRELLEKKREAYCNNFTSQIPLDLAEKLKEKEMPIKVVTGWGIFSPSFAECFDWLMSEKGLHIIVEPYWDFANEIIDTTFEWSVVKQGTIHAPVPHSYCDTWYEAATKAIEMALTLI